MFHVGTQISRLYNQIYLGKSSYIKLEFEHSRFKTVLAIKILFVNSKHGNPIDFETSCNSYTKNTI